MYATIVGRCSLVHQEGTIPDGEPKEAVEHAWILSSCPRATVSFFPGVAALSTSSLYHFMRSSMMLHQEIA